MPRLTIGVPAYNNVVTLRTTIESLLAQSFGDFRLLISDDNSKDETRAVCLDLAKSDKRIEYVRQPKNLRYQNFGYLLRQSTSELFMWGAGDDRWQSDYVEACIRELDAHPSLVLAVSKVQFEEHGIATQLSSGTYPLLGTARENLRRYFSRPDDNSRMYGVFRTMPGQRSFPANSFHAYDWAFSAATLRFGGHAEIPEILMFRDKTPTEKYTEMARADANAAIDRLFPLYQMTRWLHGEAKMPLDRHVLGALFALNVDKHFGYVSRFHPAYYRLVKPLEAVWQTRISWRLRKD